MPAPLEELKVVDLGWIMVGPVSGRYLAELGADVIKAETGKRPDPLRGLGPFKDGRPGLERSLSYHLTNANKRSLAVDVKRPEGLDLVRRLVADADVFIESFTPGAIDGMGLSYDALADANPGLIMVSTGILGRKGTLGLGMSGTGMTGSAYAGAAHLMGWPDRPPTGPLGPWTDAVAPRFIVSAILAALHRRKATGGGVHIDLAQAEAGLQFLAPAFLDHQVNGVTAERRGGLSDPLRAPCGAYPCAGDDRWVVIDAPAADAWAVLAAIVPGLDDPRFATLVGRLRHREALDTRIAAWTQDQTAEAVEQRLQAAGVPAHALCHDGDLHEDADLEHAGFYRRIEDDEIGEGWIPGPQFSLDRTPHAPTRAGPRIGDASEAILAERLGLAPDEIARLKAAGVLA
ncbi:CaiB/BaiF CoA-transferase family protein [uncultured Phenylobacterium sp.]|uniref:CaiB/BaiF CoA transferase family protein n=1 Tax=uncultured Phenylobacterium sp. TaxID=349273 RepID=UPI0025FC2B31|nr:CaiB/BaiF CoA-transferase family protein [uncultured Phenylobacterium sp.]